MLPKRLENRSAEEPEAMTESRSRGQNGKFRWSRSVWPRPTLRRLIAVALVIFFVWQAIGFAVAYSFINADYHNPQPFQSPDMLGLDFQEVSIPVEVQPGRTIKLSAWLLPADESADNFQGGAVVLMVHGFGSAKGKVWTNEATGYRASLLEQGAESLVRGGFHVLMLDFRNFGGSEDFGKITLGLRESEDVVAAVNFIAEQLPKTELTIDPQRIGIRAPSMGAATTVIALANHPELPVRAVWLDSAFATANQAVADFLKHRNVPVLFLPPIKFWMQKLSGQKLGEIEPLSRIGSITCPAMIVHSEDDTMIRVDHFLKLREATAAMPNFETWMIDGQQHHRLWLDPDYHGRQLEFFKRHLSPSANEP